MKNEMLLTGPLKVYSDFTMELLDFLRECRDPEVTVNVPYVSSNKDHVEVIRHLQNRPPESPDYSLDNTYGARGILTLVFKRDKKSQVIPLR